MGVTVSTAHDHENCEILKITIHMNFREILDTICKSYPVVLSYVIKYLAALYI